MKKLWLFIAIVLTAIIVYVMIYWWRFTSAWQPVVNSFEIQISNLNASVYVKTKTWGITYDYQLLLISAHRKKNFEYDPKQDYIYHDFSYLFYRVTDDGLEIYTRTPSPVPEAFPPNIKIIQIELENPAMMELLTTYESRGLKKFE